MTENVDDTAVATDRVCTRLGGAPAIRNLEQKATVRVLTSRRRLPYPLHAAEHG